MNPFSIIRRNQNKKVFCISMQRTGTTSVGKFFRDFGFQWAGWPADNENNWSMSCYEGDYEAIFHSKTFRESNAFEDSPWFYPGFYRILYHRFPSSRFVLFERDPDAWFRSMCNHSEGDIIGRAKTHCKIYRREIEYFRLVDQAKISEVKENTLGTKKAMKIDHMAEHYKSIYILYNREVKDFFQRHDSTAFFSDRLENPLKWINMGKFLNVEVPEDYDPHLNKTA